MRGRVGSCGSRQSLLNARRGERGLRAVCARSGNHSGCGRIRGCIELGPRLHLERQSKGGCGLCSVSWRRTRPRTHRSSHLSLKGADPSMSSRRIRDRGRNLATQPNGCLLSLSQRLTRLLCRPLTLPPKLPLGVQRA